MSRTINPILLDKTPEVDTRRNWARAAQPADGTAFTKQLNKAQAQDTPRTVAPAAAANTATETETSGTKDIKPATSWRVDRSGADVHHEVNDFSFDDFLDVINPLQHIPILGSIYREMSGDEIKPYARVAGDVLFGAVTGSLLISGIASVATAAYEQQTGEEPIIQVADALFGIKKSSPDAAPATMLADASGEKDLAGSSPGGTEEVKLAAVNEIAPTSLPAPSPAPVQVAAVDAGMGTANNGVPAAQATTTVDKPPYGGVMDTSAAMRNQQIAAAKGAVPNVKGLRIGNTIYTNPQMNNSARLAAIQAERAKAAAASANSPPPEAKPAGPSDAPKDAAPSPFLAGITRPSPDMSLPGSETANGAPAQMTQQATGAGPTGRPLPPELVRDMMIMALDKYKTAGGLGPIELGAAAPN